MLPKREIGAVPPYSPTLLSRDTSGTDEPSRVSLPLIDKNRLHLDCFEHLANRRGLDRKAISLADKALWNLGCLNLDRFLAVAD